MWEQLSTAKKFGVVASGVLGVCSVALGMVVFGMLVLSSGGGEAAGEKTRALLKGALLIGLGVSSAYSSYSLATRGTEDPEGAYDFNKCPACGKFTRGATVCRHCGHDLTHGVADTPPT